jgi:hypothetical protein
MKIKAFTLPLAGTLLCGGLASARAQNADWSQTDRLSLGYRMAYNITTKFSNVGSPALANNPSLTGRSYGDGFVGTDDTQNVGGMTTHWGYQRPDQVQDGNGLLLLRSANAGQVGGDIEDGPHSGLELGWQHELGGNSTVRWGFEAAVNWGVFSARQNTVAAPGVLAVDAFGLGYTPPEAPYVGPVGAGPNTPLLGVSPSASLPVSVDSSLEADLYGVRLGPYLDLPLCHWAALTFSAGLAMTVMDGRYSFTESYRTPGGMALGTTGGASKTSALWGGYVGVQLNFRLAEHWNVFTGIQYQGTSSYTVVAADQQAEVDFGGALYSSIGLSWSF